MTQWKYFCFIDTLYFLYVLLMPSRLELGERGLPPCLPTYSLCSFLWRSVPAALSSSSGSSTICNWIPAGTGISNKALH